MLGDEDEEEYDEYVDIIDNQRAIFTVDDSEIYEIQDTVNSFKESEDNDKEETKSRMIGNIFGQLSFTN